MKGQVQEFRPKTEALARIIELADRPGHPNLDDIMAMAMDTASGCGGRFTPSADQLAAAKQTIKDLTEKPACPSTEKSS